MIVSGVNQLGEHDRALRSLLYPEQCLVMCGPKHAIAKTSHQSALQDPMIHTLDVGKAGSGQLIRSTLQEIRPSIVITLLYPTYPSWEDGVNQNHVTDGVECHCQVTCIPYLQVDVGDTTRWQ